MENTDFKDYTQPNEAEEILNRMKLLGVTSKELAEELGVSEKSVYRYLHVKMPESKEPRINRILDRRSVYKKYSHMPPKELASFLRKLFSVLGGAVTQKRVAEAVGVSQKYISTLMKKDAESDDDLPQTTTKMQYEILSAVFDIYSEEAKNHSQYFPYLPLYPNRTVHELCERLGKRVISDNQFDEWKTEQADLLIDYLDNLSDNEKRIIMANNLAFFDTACHLWLYDQEENVSVVEFFAAFESLSPENRELFRGDLENLVYENRIFQYYDHRDNWDLFNFVTQYRNMMVVARLMRNDDMDYEPRIFAGERVFDINIRYKPPEFSGPVPCKEDFAPVITGLIQYADDSWNDILYKFRMGAYEWYVWMLFASYVFAMGEQDSIYELMEKYM